ncbi:MAG: potassium transporter Kup, partial [Rubrivivax sp.]
MSSPSRPSAGRPPLGLAVAAIGVVYGDIGTSPLYALKEVFAEGRVPLTPEHVLGILSLVFWTLTVIVSLKYVTLILRADNHGEGGLVAMLALASQAVKDRPQLRARLLLVGIFGTAIFFGDGVITPAVSVLSAVEGLEVAAPALHAWVVPVSLVVLGALFAGQRFGTAAVGRFFGPVMLVWFAVLAALGLWHVARGPAVLAALSPHHALAFMLAEPGVAFIALGAVVLCVTGAEALYADLGHFGKRPIRLAWFAVVMPALVLNYFGQGALLLADPQAVRNPFYEMAPSWALYPLIALATLAAVIASQALITAAFSVTKQVIQLGYLPRLRIAHTSIRETGQIYIPAVNWGLFAFIVVAVVAFRSSGALASAYGIAVTIDMTITTIMTFFVIRFGWRLPLGLCLAATGTFFVVDLVFFAANAVKVLEGGWFPLVIGALMFTLMTTWQRGRTLLGERLRDDAIDLDSFLEAVFVSPPVRVPGTAVFLNAERGSTPFALLHNLKHNKVLHERNLFVTVQHHEVPWVGFDRRLEVEPLGHDCWQLTLHFGFKNDP